MQVVGIRYSITLRCYCLSEWVESKLVASPPHTFSGNIVSIERIARMHRKFIATVVATSILFTGFAAAPARANQEDVGRALAALLGIAIVGAVIHDSNKDNKAKVQVYSQPQKKVQKKQFQKKKKHVQTRPLPRRVLQHLLPSKCLRSFETRRGTARIFGQRCLERNYGFTHRLPQHCERCVRTDRGLRFGFGARCLRKQGYKLTRR